MLYASAKISRIFKWFSFQEKVLRFAQETEYSRNCTSSDVENSECDGMTPGLHFLNF